MAKSIASNVTLANRVSGQIGQAGQAVRLSPASGVYSDNTPVQSQCSAQFSQSASLLTNYLSNLISDAGGIASIGGQMAERDQALSQEMERLHE